jgi:hypothetical protein
MHPNTQETMALRGISAIARGAVVLPSMASTRMSKCVAFVGVVAMDNGTKHARIRCVVGINNIANGCAVKIDGFGWAHCEFELLENAYGEATGWERT